jgi:hypothetical protein
MFGMRSSLYMVAGSSTPVAAAAPRPVVKKPSAPRPVVKKPRAARATVQQPSARWPVVHQPHATYPTLPGRYPAPASLSNPDRSAE